MTDVINDNQFVTINNIRFELANLPAKVQQLVGMHVRWSADLDAINIEHMKTSAALRDIDRQIGVEMEPIFRMVSGGAQVLPVPVDGDSK